MREAVSLAAEEVSGVGVLGRSLQLLHRDSQTNSAVAVGATEELISLGVPAIIGAAASNVSWPMANVTVPSEVLQVSPSSTSPIFTTLEPKEPGWFWRTVASDVHQGKVAAMRAAERGWMSVGILAMDVPGWVSVADAFRENFTGNGKSVPVQVNFGLGQTSYTSELQLIANVTPDAVFFLGRIEEGFTIMQDWWANRGLPGWNWNWLFWEFLRMDDFIQNLRNVGIEVQGIEGVAAVLEGPNYPTFRNEFLATYGRVPQIYAAHAYDAVYLLALAAVAAQAWDSLSIRDHLLPVANPGGTVVGPGVEDFERAVCALEVGGNVNYEGAAGRVNFDVVGDVGSPYVIWQIDQNGMIVEANLIPESTLWPPSSGIVTDATSPIVSISSPSPDSTRATGDVTATWSASDQGSGLDYFVVRLDAGVPVCLPRTASSHTFSGVPDGSHTIAITAYDLAGNGGVASIDVGVDTAQPRADAGGDKTARVGEAVSFDASGSSDNLGIVSFEWDFGDGSAGLGETTTHAYTEAGAYTVILAIRDAAGNADTDLLTVTVEDASELAPVVVVAAIVPVQIVVIIIVVLVYGRPGRGSA